MNRQPSFSDWAILFLLALMWGASFLMIKKALVVYDPVQCAFMRMGMATAVYLPLAVLYFKKIDWSKWRPLLVVALCGSGIPNYFFALAQTKVSSSLAGILNSLTPLFTLLLGVLFFDMRSSRHKAIGVGLGLVGAVLLMLFGRGLTAKIGGESLFAIFCVLATICYAINANTVQRHLTGVHPVAIGAASFFLTGPAYLAGVYFSGAWDATWAHPSPGQAVGSLAYLAVIGTAAASMLYFYLLQQTSAIFATSVTYLLPVIAIVLGILDGEEVTLVHFAGTALILTGLYLARK